MSSQDKLYLNFLANRFCFKDAVSAYSVGKTDPSTARNDTAFINQGHIYNTTGYQDGKGTEALYINALKLRENVSYTFIYQSFKSHYTKIFLVNSSSTNMNVMKDGGSYVLSKSGTSAGAVTAINLKAYDENHGHMINVIRIAEHTRYITTV
jgi:hypothetical protein